MYKIKHTQAITIFVLILFISACSSMYIPSMSNIPLLEEKEEAQIELAASTNSVHLSGAYAFSAKYAFMAHGSLSYMNFTDNYDVFTHKSDGSSSILDLRTYGEFAHRNFELGLGRYNILKNKKKLEVFGGLGFGKADHFNLHTNYYLGFAQVNWGKTLGFLDVGFSSRIAPIFFDFEYGTYDNNTELWSSKNIDLLYYNFELASLIRYGFERLKFVTKLGVSNSFVSKSTEDRISRESEKNLDFDSYKLRRTFLHISFGINYRFGTRERN